MMFSFEVISKGLEVEEVGLKTIVDFIIVVILLPCVLNMNHRRSYYI